MWWPELKREKETTLVFSESYILAAVKWLQVDKPGTMGADFEISPGSTTENLDSFVPSNYFTAHVKLHNVTWNWSFSCHASTIPVFFFFSFSPQWIFISQIDRKAGRGAGEGKGKKKMLFNSPSVWGYRNALSWTQQTEKRVGRDYQKPGKRRVQLMARWRLLWRISNLCVISAGERTVAPCTERRLKVTIVFSVHHRPIC